MAKSYNFIVPLVIYEFDIMFSVGESNYRASKAVEQRLMDSDFKIFQDDELLFKLPDTCNGRTVHNLEGSQTIIRLRNKPIDANGYAVLAHEIFHAVDFIMRRIGITLSSDSDEAYAYLIGYVTREFFKALK